jgi:hypothetical protein
MVGANVVRSNPSTNVSSNSADHAGKLTGNLNSFDFAVANREFYARSVQKVGVGI